MDVHTEPVGEHKVGVTSSSSTVQGSNLEPLNMTATDTVLPNVPNHQPGAQRHMNPHLTVSLHIFTVQNSDKPRLGLTKG